MWTRTTAMVMLLVAASILQSAGHGSPLQPGVVSVQEALARQHFDRKIAEYVALHRDLEGTVPPVRISRDPAEIRAAMDALALKIRWARHDAAEGDVFIGEVANLFRRLISEGCEGDYRRLLAIVMEEAPAELPTPEVNGRWPDETPRSMMLPGILRALPELPPELEYRFIYRHLVVHDTHADVIVDVLRNAIPLT